MKKRGKRRGEKEKYAMLSSAQFRRFTMYRIIKDVNLYFYTFILMLMVSYDGDDDDDG